MRAPQAYPGFGTRGIGPQVPAYNFALSVAKKLDRWKWIGFIDLGEFILPTDTDTIGEVLREFSAFGAIGVNWRMFGSAGHVSAPQGLIIENFIRRAEDDFSANKHVKTIAQIAQLRRAGIHIPNSTTGDLVDMAGHKISWERNGIHDSVVFDKLIINHYFTKSHEEWLRKRVKGNVSSRIIDSNWERPHAMFAEYNRNELEETAILRFLPEVRRGISELNQMICDYSSLPEPALEGEEL